MIQGLEVEVDLVEVTVDLAVLVGLVMTQVLAVTVHAVAVAADQVILMMYFVFVDIC